MRAEQAAGRLLVRVVDQGPGIPEDQREQVFERFYQATSGLSRSQAGAGLGLAICRGFVRAHGGDIWIEPTQTGASAAFWLPLAKSEPGEVETHE